ncbi:hypothetical protein GCM10023324_30040 [Streptomyces youssoufiensis]
MRPGRVRGFDGYQPLIGEVNSVTVRPLSREAPRPAPRGLPPRAAGGRAAPRDRVPTTSRAPRTPRDHSNGRPARSPYEAHAPPRVIVSSTDNVDTTVVVWMSDATRAPVSGALAPRVGPA